MSTNLYDQFRLVPLEMNYLTSFDWASSRSTTTTSALLLVLISVLFIKHQNDKSKQKLRLIKTLKGKKLKLMPAPMRLPLIGNMYMMREYQANPWDGLNAIREQYGDIVSLQFGVHPMVLLSNLDYMKEVLLHKGEIFADRPDFSRFSIIFGGDKAHSLALCDWSEIHKVRRKFCKRAVVPSTFSARNQLLGSIITDHTKGLVAELQRRISAEPTSARLAKTDILFLTGDIFMKFLCNDKYSHDDETYQRFNWGCDYVFYDINLSQVIDFLPYLSKIGIKRDYLRELKSVTDFCRFFIDDKIFEPRYMRHKLEMEARQASGEPMAEIDDETHDYLDKIILEHLANATIMKADDYKVGFSDLLAGHTAVSNILMKLFGHLALDREAQDMLCEEARGVNLSSLSHRPPLPVAEAALLEALRFASSPVVPHIAREDTSIGDYFVPKGSNILFNYYHIHMSEEYWHEPRKYNLKRFLSENVDKTTKLKSYKLNVPKFFNPFSFGLRQCLGFRMVESISMVAAASVCERFILTTDDEQLTHKLLEPRGTVALSPLERCFEIKLTPRDN